MGATRPTLLRVVALYAPGVGLVLIEVLDDSGDPESSIPLISRTVVPAPGALAVLTPRLGLAVARRRRG